VLAWVVFLIGVELGGRQGMREIFRARTGQFAFA
jgi:hypothetical protein